MPWANRSAILHGQAKSGRKSCRDTALDMEARACQGSGGRRTARGSLGRWGPIRRLSSGCPSGNPEAQANTGQR
eukprot:1452262-Pyramimonas_sp.AAC.1